MVTFDLGLPGSLRCLAPNHFYMAIIAGALDGVGVVTYGSRCGTESSRANL